MEKKVTRRRPRKKGKIEVPSSPDISDRDLEGLVNLLWENIDGLPNHIQSLLHESTEPGSTGAVSYMLAAGWAIGKFDYKVADPWSGTKSGWVSNENLSN